MIRTTFRLVLAAALLLVGCTQAQSAVETTEPASPATEPAEAETPATSAQWDPENVERGREPMAQGESGHYGAPFTLDGPPMALNQALAECVGAGHPCKVEGTIERVCQRRGCWYALTAADVEAIVRVRMRDYAFFVPMDAAGANVVLEGLLAHETISQELAQHYADEAAEDGGPPRRVEGPETIFQFLSTGATITYPDTGPY